MAGANSVLTTIILFSALAAILAVADGSCSTSSSFSSPEKFTKLHFYVHDFVHGENQSVYDVMESSITRQSSSWFGRVQVADHLITSGPEIHSPRVGRIQGIHVMADLQEAALEANWNVVFDDDGSTITVVGRLVALGKEGELSVVGGTGKYAMARGIVLKRTVRMDPETLNSVMEYTLYVLSTSSGGLRAV